MLNIVLWIAFGLIAGILASKIIHSYKNRTAPLLLLGIVGAVIGGIFGQLLSRTSPASLNILSIAIALCGAVMLIGTYSKISPQS